MLHWYYLLLCSLFKWACLLSISHDFILFFFIRCSLCLQCGIRAQIHSLPKDTLMPEMVGLPEKHEEEVYGGPFNFLWDVMQISSGSIWERWCLSWYPGTLAVAGCCCFRHMVSGRGSGKLTKHRSLKWLLALLTKIGELSADRETSGICSNSNRTLQCRTTKLSLNFYSNFGDQAMKKKNTKKQQRNKQKKCRNLKSQVVHLNKNKMKKHLSSSLKFVLIKRQVNATREIPISFFW